MIFVKWTRAARGEMEKVGYSAEWVEVVNGYLACAFDRMLDFNSTLVSWMSSVEAIGHTFVRYAFPITWDFSEGAISNEVRGGYQLCLDKVLSSMETISSAHTVKTPNCGILCQSATNPINLKAETIITDPPYYDAIPFADLSDFFFIWLRRTIGNQFSGNSSEPLTPKINELVQHTGRFEGNKDEAKKFYEKGMAESFQSAYQALSNDGRMVIVFAHKAPEAWETLVKAMIESGLVVTTSWPINTERGARMSAQGMPRLRLRCGWSAESVPQTPKRVITAKSSARCRSGLPNACAISGTRGFEVQISFGRQSAPALESYSSYKVVPTHGR